MRNKIKVMGVREFKGKFTRLLDDDEEIYVTSRGEPVALFVPLLGKKREIVRKQIARQLIGLGKGKQKGRASEEHDEELYYL
jgi:antitoxin (DNA-binding transcriptional repressor) of toxin-antitoxin stability system